MEMSCNMKIDKESGTKIFKKKKTSDIVKRHQTDKEQVERKREKVKWKMKSSERNIGENKEKVRVSK